MAGRELRDHTTHLRLRDWLGAAQARALARGAEDAADDAADAALDLSQTHWSGAADRELAPDEEFQRRSPFALPIVLEADDGFFPEQDQTRGVRWMIDTGIPEMRDEIRRQSGFGVPGVRIRGKAQLAGRRYRILVLEVPVADGEVPADERDPYRFMVARLLDAVRCRVSWFVNVQTVEAPLGGAERPVAERTGLVRLLRALAEDGVPIDDIDAIAAQRGPQVSDDVVAERLRADRRDRLWGRELPPVEVSEDLEARLAEFAPLPAGFEDLAAENERLLALRDELGELIPAEPVALVVRSRDVRPVVRRLVALDRPDVPVLSADELPQRASRLVPFAGGRRS
jgi:flagellar biosynthesis component FlhA